MIVCPSKPESSLCIHSSTYLNTLKTHTTPPIQYVLSHPFVAPYVQKIEPAYRHVSRYTSPVLDKLKSITGPIILRIENVLDEKIGQYIRPYVHKASLQFNARYKYYVRYARPYINQGRRLALRMSPYIEHTKFALQQSRYKAQLFIHHAQLYGARGWIIVRPYLIVVLEKMNEVPVWVRRRLGPLICQVYKTYIEPQIRKILAKVDELSNSSGKGTLNTTPPSKTVPSSLSSTVEVKTSDSDAIPTAKLPISSPIESISTAIPAPVVSKTAEATSATESTAERTPHSPSPASSVLSTQVSPAEREPEAESRSEVDDIVEDIFKEPIKPTVIQLPTEDEATSTPISTAQKPTSEEILEKRRKIEERHAAWEAKLDEVGKAGIESVILPTSFIRQKAADSLLSADDGTITVQIATLKAEGAKALKG